MLMRTHDTVRRVPTHLCKRFQDHLHAVVFFLFERVVAGGRVVEIESMRDDERRVESTGFDVFEQRPHVPLDMTLAASDCQRPLHDCADRELVDEASVRADDRYHATVTATCDRLA